MRKSRSLFLLLVVLLTGCFQDPGSPVGSGMKAEQQVINAEDRETESQVDSEQETLEPHEKGGEADLAKLEMIFGFTDETGRRLIATGIENTQKDLLSQFAYAIGENGNVISVKYENWQEGDDAGTGRDLSNNFDHLAGHVFSVTEGKAQQNETYYFFHELAMPLGSLLGITTDGQPVKDETLWRKIETDKDRKLQKLLHLADIAGDNDLYLAHFERTGNEHMFSLILNREQGVSYLDFPKVAEDTNGVWRVDDQGEVDQNTFSFLFAAKSSEKGILLGMEWNGAEGINTLFLHGDGEHLTQLETRYGRYTSP
ncbi:hypothetical protein [Paenibacillus macerans]|uniref:hypothetical protein n=1 Tax=Paenibacillus macerans TaxID=44252 RepID=UPI003D31165F